MSPLFILARRASFPRAIVAAGLLIAGLPAQVTPPTPRPMVVELKPGSFINAACLPLPVQRPVRESVQVPGSNDPLRARVRDGVLELDVGGRGSFEARLPPKKVSPVAIGTGDARKTLIFHRVLDTWFCGPGQAWRGKSSLGAVEILDADLDGAITDKDFLRWEGGSFMPIDPARLVAAESGLHHFEIRKKDGVHVLELTPVASPAWATPLQLRALTACNRARNRAGLAPLQLDRKRCDGCQLHATYLDLNNYSYDAPWDGVGSHDEAEGKPGFTPEGREAARQSATSADSDPAEAIEDQMATILHRVAYIGSAAEGFGAGVVARLKARGGYCVLWGPDVGARADDLPVVVPAPGQTDVPIECEPERPAVESRPAFYDAPRGFPISVTRTPWDLKNAWIRLIGPDKKTGSPGPVAGSCFSPQNPVHSTRPANADSAVFVADAPLERNKTYIVELTASRNDEAATPVRLLWTFTTGTGVSPKLPPVK